MDPYSIKSAKRTLELFELFAEIRRPARVTELQRLLDLPQSSTTKLLHTFEKLGYLQYDGKSRTYYPTLRVTLLGSWLHDQCFGHESLLMAMEALRAEFGTSVLLGIQSDKYVLYMLALQALQNPRPPLSIGTLRPICRAAVGKALIMSKSDNETDLLVRRINAEEPDPAQRVNYHDFMDDIALCRKRGYALSDGSVVPGVGVVSMPLRQLPNQPQMAIGIGGWLDWLTPNLDSIVQALKETVAALPEMRALAPVVAEAEAQAI